MWAVWDLNTCLHFCGPGGTNPKNCPEIPHIRVFPRLHASSDNSLYTGLTRDLLSIQSHIIFIKCSTCNDFIIWNRREIIIWVDVWAYLWILGMKRKLHEFYKVNPHLSHMVVPLKIFWIHLPQKDIWLPPGSLNIFFATLFCCMTLY